MIGDKKETGQIFRCSYSEMQFYRKYFKGLELTDKKNQERLCGSFIKYKGLLLVCVYVCMYTCVYKTHPSEIIHDNNNEIITIIEHL